MTLEEEFERLGRLREEENKKKQERISKLIPSCFGEDHPFRTYTKMMVPILELLIYEELERRDERLVEKVLFKVVDEAQKLSEVKTVT